MRKFLGIQIALLLTIFTMSSITGAEMTREDYVNEVNRISLELKNLTSAKLSLEGGLANISLQLDALAAKKANTSDAKTAELIVTEIKNVEASYLATDAKLNFVKNQISSLTNSLSDLKLKLAAFPTPSISPVPTSSPTLNTAAKLRIVEIDSRITSLQKSITSSTQYIEILKVKLREMQATLSTTTDPQTKTSIAANASRTANEILMVTSAISNAKAEISSLTAEKTSLLATGTGPVATTSPTAKPSAQVKKFGTIRCQKGKEIKKIMGYNPVCPKGYTKI